MKAGTSSSTLPFDAFGEALARFGYSEPESSFLTLAALHGGYFLRRQVAEFFGGRDGGRVTQLVQKTLSLEHARSSTLLKNVQLYHLLSRPLYGALGDPDNRNRRRHEWSQIKNRVMRLDFVLAHRNDRFLATEREKVEHFASLGISSETLPSKAFVGRHSASATSRYFVDKYPIFLRGTSADASARIGFAFVDEGLAGLSKFQSHLGNYRRLFEAIGAFEFIYVAGADTHFGRARAAFERLANGGNRETSGEDVASASRLLAYFELRKRYEQRAFGSFDRNDLLRLRDARAHFSDPNYDALFATWQTDGDTLLAADPRVEEPAGTPIRGTFRTHLLRHDYSFFGGYGLR